MSTKLRKQATVEIEQLHALLDRHRDVVKKCRKETPSDLEMDALATQIHCFYNGVENLFKRITVDLDRRRPSGEAWHTHLLDSMTHTTDIRPAVISNELASTLKAYLDFRHMFRHAYTFNLRWRHMAPLVWDMEDVFTRFKSEIERFLETLSD